MQKVDNQKLLSILPHFGIDDPDIEPLETGLINHSWRVSTGCKRFTLQRVNPIFPAGVHIDIEVVTAHLESRGMTTPRLVRTRDGNLYYQDSGEIVWRLYSYIEGLSHNTAGTPQIAYQAGILLGQFHRALEELDYAFTHGRAGVHDTRAHISRLELALRQKTQHPRYRDISPLASEILDLAGHLPLLPDMQKRKVHGDPKLNNFLFAADTGKGICMLDFDTLSHMQLPLELGDALRSWCNPAGENTPETFFSVNHFQAGLEAYASVCKAMLTRLEQESILPAIRIILVELAARFCADALYEDYFAWDPKNFSSHSEHSQARALGQLNACKSLDLQYSQAEQVLKAIIS